MCVSGALHLISIYSDTRYQRILEQALNVVRYIGIRNPIVSRRILTLLGCKLNAYPGQAIKDSFSPPAQPMGCFSGYPELRPSSSRVPGSTWSSWATWQSAPRWRRQCRLGSVYSAQENQSDVLVTLSSTLRPWSWAVFWQTHHPINHL